MATTESRIERIKSTRKSLDKMANLKEEIANNKVEEYKTAIELLQPRLEEMFKVADEMVKNNIHFGKRLCSITGMEHDEFETDGINHGIGFVFSYEKGGSFRFNGDEIRHRTAVIGIGIRGGGCCGEDIIVNRMGNIIKNPMDIVIGLRGKEQARSDFFGKANSFLQGFDKFEGCFYDYVDSLGQQ